MNQNDQAKEDIKFLLSFAPNLDLVEGMCPTMYVGLSYEKDLELKEKIVEIKQRWGLEDE